MKRTNQNQNRNKSKQGQVKLPAFATSYTQEATKEIEGLMDRVNLILELSKIGDADIISKIHKVINLFLNPKSFKEAYNHPEKAQREKWIYLIKKEFN